MEFHSIETRIETFKMYISPFFLLRFSLEKKITVEFIHFFYHEIVEFILNINQSAFEGTGKQDLAYLERKNSQIKISQKAGVTKVLRRPKLSLADLSRS